jgi:hypothetical protein
VGRLVSSIHSGRVFCASALLNRSPTDLGSLKVGPEGALCRTGARLGRDQTHRTIFHALIIGPRFPKIGSLPGRATFGIVLRARSWSLLLVHTS